MTSLAFGPSVMMFGRAASPPVLTYIGTSNSTGDLTTYTFTAQGIGTAAADRFVVVAVGGGKAANATISSVTIGGVTATQLAAVAASRPVVGLFGLTVTTGTTANIVVTFAAGMDHAYIAVYTITGLNSTTPTSTNSTDDGAAGTVVSHAVTESTDGVLVTVAGSRDADSTIWTNATEDSDVSLETLPAFSSAKVTSGLGTGSRTITATFNVSAASRVLATIVMR